MKIKNNSDWLILPVYYKDIVPDHIQQLAEKLKADPTIKAPSLEELALSKGIKPGGVRNTAFRRDVIECVIGIEDEEVGRSMITFTEHMNPEGFLYKIIQMDLEKLVKKIHDFLSVEPTYTQKFIDMNNQMEYTTVIHHQENPQNDG